jgi:uroporphyrin-III C-methyltransferase
MDIDETEIRSSDSYRAPSPRAAGKVYLVGAGPGDPGLLTLKGARALARADVVVYDALVHPDVLAHARPGAARVFAGKRAGRPSAIQSEIDALLVERAKAGLVVARVKGGDPFVFGRGGEEVAALRSAGVDYEVIPGVTAGLAAPASIGVPLTHRDVASSVAFIAGHDAPAKTRERVDWRAIGASADTLVIFMCAATIGRIAVDLIASGRSGATPVAVVSRATRRDAASRIATLAALAANRVRFDAPAIAIVGEVVRLSPLYATAGAEEREVRYDPQVA